MSDNHTKVFQPTINPRRVLSASTGSVSAADYGGDGFRTNTGSSSYKITSEAPLTFLFAGSDPVLVFANVIAGASAALLEAANSGTVKIKGAWKKTSSTGRWHPITWKGVTQYSCAAGEIVESDPLYIRHASGDQITVRLYFDGSTGSVGLPGTLNSCAASNFKMDYNNDATDGSALTDDASGSGDRMPWILGCHSIPDNPGQRAVLVIGDSIADGNTAIVDFSSFKVGRGWQCQTLTALGIPWSISCEIGLLASSLIGNTSFKTSQYATNYIARYCTDIWFNLGTNDFNNSVTDATMRTNASILTDTFTNAGKKVWWSTVTPFSAKTTGDAVVQPASYAGSNMDSTAFGYLNSFNDYLRAGSLVPTSRVIEAADVIQVTRNNIAAKTSYLNTGGATPDSIPVHPNPTGEAALVSACTTNVRSALAS